MDIPTANLGFAIIVSLNKICPGDCDIDRQREMAAKTGNTTTTTTTTTNNNNNNHDDIYSAVIMAEPLREFTRFTR